MDEMIEASRVLMKLAQSDTARYGLESIQALKRGKDKDAVINRYDEIFSNLVAENQELKNIALAYKGEYEKANITDENIEYLKNTFERVLNLLVEMGDEKDSQKTKEDFEQFTSLIDVDTLKTMQLLGFNYKQAIGEPLTLILSDFIKRKYTAAISYYPSLEEEDVDI